MTMNSEEKWELQKMLKEADVFNELNNVQRAQKLLIEILDKILDNTPTTSRDGY